MHISLSGDIKRHKTLIICIHTIIHIILYIYIYNIDYIDIYRVWGIRPAKVCEASKLQSLFGASRLKASKPQSCKAPLAPHASKLQSLSGASRLKASKLQSLFGASRFKASKPQSLNAWMLWRFGAWRLFQALALLGAFPTPQSLKA